MFSRKISSFIGEAQRAKPRVSETKPHFTTLPVPPPEEYHSKPLPALPGMRMPEHKTSAYPPVYPTGGGLIIPTPKPVESPVIISPALKSDKIKKEDIITGVMVVGAVVVISLIASRSTR